MADVFVGSKLGVGAPAGIAGEGRVARREAIGVGEGIGGAIEAHLPQGGLGPFVERAAEAGFDQEELRTGSRRDRPEDVAGLDLGVESRLAKVGDQAVLGRKADLTRCLRRIEPGRGVGRAHEVGE